MNKMSFLQVNESKCKKDGLCAMACPMGLLVVEPGRNFPKPIPGADTLCLQCGHCVSACPHAALSLSTIKVEDCVPLQRELNVSVEQTAQLLKSRRSIRRYKPDPLERRDIEALIDAARYAPSGKNTQPLSWLVVYDAAAVHTLAAHVADWMKDMLKNKHPMSVWLQFENLVKAWDNGIDAILRNAPHLIITHAPKANPMAPQSAIIALTTFEIAAAAAGFGTCWAGFFQIAVGLWEPLQKALNLPEGHISHGALMLGRPAVKYYRIPPRKKPDVMWR
jgi:nitroreductase/NAD-dependent dihydropyrimidine dehydrogenase PreA subunit